MAQRHYTLHATGAPQPDLSGDEEQFRFIGRTLFVGLASRMIRYARVELRRSLAAFQRDTKNREKKNAVYNWFILAELFTLVVAAEKKDHVVSVPLRSAFDNWSAFATIAGWRLRDMNTVRGMDAWANDDADGRAWRLNGKRPSAASAALRARARQAWNRKRKSSTTSPESDRNDLLSALRDDLTKFINTETVAGGTRATIVSRVLARIERDIAPKFRQHTTGLSEEAALRALMGLLLTVRKEQRLYVEGPIAAVDDALRLAQREIRRTLLSRHFQRLPRNVQAALATSTAPHVEAWLHKEANIALEQNASLRIDSAKFSAALTGVVVMSPRKLATALRASTPRGFQKLANAQMKPNRERIKRRLRKLGTPAHLIARVLRLHRDGAAAWDGTRFLDAVLLASGPRECAIVENPRPARAVVSTELSRLVLDMFGSQKRWDVAIPVEDWTVDANAGATLHAFGKLSQAWAAAPHPILARADDDDRRLSLVRRSILAPNASQAASLARSDIDDLLSFIWFTRPERPSLAELGLDAVVRGAAGGFRQRRKRHGRTIGAAEFRELEDQMKAARKLIAGSRDSDLYRRLRVAIWFFRRALLSRVAFDRYAFLWFALESLLSNLAIDDIGGVPAETRIAHRAASVLRPDRSLRGQTYGLFRWAKALELRGLYYVRNKAVHEGMHDPPVDQVMIEHFTSDVLGVLARVLHLGLRDGARSIEEVLGMREHHHPDGARVGL